MGCYSRSKKANLIYAKELQKRMNESKINGISVSLHPGFVRTDLTRDMIDSSFKRFLFGYILPPIFHIIGKSSAEGAQTTLYAVL